jgi:predicted dithiol-disulfide oxidoreductase (DUF899 family)
VIYRFMFDPTYTAGCPTNSSIAHSFNGVLAHLKARDVTLICVSRAPVDKLLAYRDRMGWSFNWASSYNSDFTFDFGVSSTEETTRVGRAGARRGLDAADRQPERRGMRCRHHQLPLRGFGVDVFARERDTVYHTYSSDGRGVEFLMGYYPILDRTPRGRDEGNAFQTWLRRRDEYSSR